MVSFRAISFPSYLNLLLGRATVVDYDDTSSVEEPIPFEYFYTRRTYNSVLGSFSVRRLPYTYCYTTQHATVAQARLELDLHL